MRLCLKETKKKKKEKGTGRGKKEGRETVQSVRAPLISLAMTSKFRHEF